MINKKIFIGIVFAIAIAMAFGFQNSSEHKVLFEKAKFTMETKGDLKGAIKLFEQIIQKYPDQRDYAAKSQLYIGLCYEKLGQTQANQAQKAFQKVVDNYPEQAETVKVANEKLITLTKVQTFVKEGDKEFKIRQVWVNPDVLFLADLGYICQPSPDGHYLAYTDKNTVGLAVLDLITKKKRILTKGFISQEGALYPIWSPDSSRIAYSCVNLKDRACELRIIGLNGSKSHVLYRHEKELPDAVVPLDWSPDGRNILAGIIDLEGKDWSAQGVLVSVVDGSVHDMGTFDKLPQIEQPRAVLFSPDGHYIVLDLPTKKDTDNHDIFLFSVDGNREIPIVEAPADDFALGWAPDGKRLVFASDRTGTLDVWAVHVADGKPQGDPELIKKDIGSITPLGITKEGSFYYGLQTNMMDVYIAWLDLKKGKFQTPPTRATQRSTGSNCGSAWFPDGKYLLYRSRRDIEHPNSSKSPFCIRSMETGKERELFIGLEEFGGNIVFPDGRFILVRGSDKKGRRGFYKINAQTSDVSLLFKFDSEDVVWSPAFSSDGKKLFYAFRKKPEKSVHIQAYDLITQKKEEIYEGTAFNYLSLSPDGRFLAFVTRDSRGFYRTLNVLPVNGGAPREVLQLKQKEQISAVTWTPDGQELLFAKGKGKKQKSDLLRVSVEGGKPKKIGSVKGELRRLRFHPDGRRISFVTEHESTEIWVMENFLPEAKQQKKSKSRQ